MEQIPLATISAEDIQTIVRVNSIFQGMFGFAKSPQYQDDLLSNVEAAEYIDESTVGIPILVEKGLLKSFSYKGKLLFTKQDLDKYLLQVKGDTTGLFSANDLKKLLQISSTLLKKLLKEGRINEYKKGKLSLYKVSEIHQAILILKKEVANERA